MTLPEIRPELAGADDVLVVHGAENIAAYDLAIEGLARRCEVPVTGRWTWMSATAAQPQVNASACLLGTDGDLRGAAVFVHDIDTSGVRHVRLASGGDGHRAFVLALDDDDAAALGVAMADLLTSADGPMRVELGPLPAGDVALQSLLLALPARSSVTVIEDVVPSVRQAGPLLDDHLSHGMLRTIRKSRNRLATDGVAAEFRTTRDADEILARLPEIAAVSRDRDHAGGRASMLDEVTGLRRWTARLNGLARLCHLELCTLMLDGQPAAYVLGLEDGDAYRLLDGRFVMAWKRYAPGRLLEAHVLQRVLDHPGLRELDWMTSAAPETLIAANAAIDVVTARITL